MRRPRQHTTTTTTTKTFSPIPGRRWVPRDKPLRLFFVVVPFLAPCVVPENVVVGFPSSLRVLRIELLISFPDATGGFRWAQRAVRPVVGSASGADIMDVFHTLFFLVRFLF